MSYQLLITVFLSVYSDIVLEIIELKLITESCSFYFSSSRGLFPDDCAFMVCRFRKDTGISLGVHLNIGD